jgi:hypothetical protein
MRKKNLRSDMEISVKNQPSFVSNYQRKPKEIKKRISRNKKNQWFSIGY